MNHILENELFEAFANASDSVYIYVCDVKKDISRWSPNTVDYFNLEGEYFKNAGEVWSKNIHPEDRDVYFEDIRGVFGGTKKHHNCQYRAINKYGEYVWLECKGSMIYDKNGEASVFAGLMTRLDGQNKYDNLTNLLTIHEFNSYDFTGKSGCAMLIGIDDFRKIISSYGYVFGDKILIEFAKKLKEICTKDTKLYRMGGDEFLIIFPGADKEDISIFFEKMMIELENMTIGDSGRINLSVSAGIVCYPEHGDTRDMLVTNMEHSLEYVKAHNKGHYCFFSESIAQKHKRILLIKEDLKNSIKNDFDGFELYFQPLVGIQDKKIKGCEALLRWKGEKVKDSNPGEFIKILEDDGDIIAVGKWVMESAIKQQRNWQERYGDIQVSFNVSYQQFMTDDFADIIIETSEKYDVKPQNMIIELTESRRVEQPETLAAVFQKLLNAGFQVAFDDFGTGYASLEMLKKLPVSFIKIEHSFVRELAKPQHEIDRIIIESLLSLSKKLNYYSIIEGVENKDVDEIIKNMDATYLQGYYYSRPVTVTDFEKMLDTDFMEPLII